MPELAPPRSIRQLVTVGMFAPYAWALLLMCWAAIYTLADGADALHGGSALFVLVTFWLSGLLWLLATIAALMRRDSSRWTYAGLGAAGGILLPAAFGASGVAGLGGGGPYVAPVVSAGITLLFIGWATVPLGLLSGIALASLPPFVQRYEPFERAGVLAEMPGVEAPTVLSASVKGRLTQTVPRHSVLAWASTLLSIPHLLVAVPCVVYAILFLTVRFDLGGLSGHPQHRNWEDRAPGMFMIFCASAPVACYGILLLAAGHGLARGTARGRALGLTAAALSALIGACFLAVLLLFLIGPQSWIEPIVGGSYPRSYTSIFPSVGVWVYGAYAVAAFAILGEKRPIAVVRWMVFVAATHAAILVVVAIVEPWVRAAPIEEPKATLPADAAPNILGQDAPRSEGPR